MKRINSQKMKPNGRGHGKEPFICVLWAILDHPDYRRLSKTSRAFLWDVARQHNGFNNGNLTVAPSVLGAMGWEKKTIYRCRDELVDAGWIAVTRLPRAKREPILYRLTWLDLGRWEGKPILDPDALTAKRRSLRLPK